MERDTDVRFETVALDDVLAATAGASLRMVILDACRNNPLARSMQRTVARRSVSGGSFGDLNEDLLGDETLVAYAAAAGTTAADGRGRNSPYTSALLAYLEEPLELSAVFRRVRARVLDSTDGQQRPHEYGSLVREHYLSGVSTTPPIAVAGADGARLQQENLFWQSIMGSTNAADFEAYLGQFPDGVYRALAVNRLAERRAAPGDPPRTRPAEPGSVFRDCAGCPEMVVVPAGRFRMGCASGSDICEDDEWPGHEVAVPRFALSQYEVTRGQFARFVAATGYRTPGECNRVERGSWRDQSWQTDEHPVVCVTRDDARAYVRWLGESTGFEYRLPSESEWEYAARAGTTTRWYWDREQDRCAHGNAGEWNGWRTAGTHPTTVLPATVRRGHAAGTVAVPCSAAVPLWAVPVFSVPAIVPGTLPTSGTSPLAFVLRGHSISWTLKLTQYRLLDPRSKLTDEPLSDAKTPPRGRWEESPTEGHRAARLTVTWGERSVGNGNEGGRNA